MNALIFLVLIVINVFSADYQWTGHMDATDWRDGGLGITITENSSQFTCPSGSRKVLGTLNKRCVNGQGASDFKYYALCLDNIFKNYSYRSYSVYNACSGSNLNVTQYYGIDPNCPLTTAKATAQKDSIAAACVAQGGTSNYHVGIDNNGCSIVTGGCDVCQGDAWATFQNNCYNFCKAQYEEDADGDGICSGSKDSPTCIVFMGNGNPSCNCEPLGDPYDCENPPSSASTGSSSGGTSSGASSSGGSSSSGSSGSSSGSSGSSDSGTSSATGTSSSGGGTSSESGYSSSTDYNVSSSSGKSSSSDDNYSSSATSSPSSQSSNSGSTGGDGDDDSEEWGRLFFWTDSIAENTDKTNRHLERSNRLLDSLIGNSKSGDSAILSALKAWGDSMSKWNGADSSGLDVCQDEWGNFYECYTGLGNGSGSGTGNYSGYFDSNAVDGGFPDGDSVSKSWYDDQLAVSGVAGASDSVKAFSTSLRTKTDMDFLENYKTCPDSLYADACSWMDAFDPGVMHSCKIDFCDTRFYIGGKHPVELFGVLMELSAWLLFFVRIKTS